MGNLREAKIFKNILKIQSFLGKYIDFLQYLRYNTKDVLDH